MGKKLLIGLEFVLCVLCQFVILVVFNFGFEGGTLVLIAPFSCHCDPLALLWLCMFLCRYCVLIMHYELISKFNVGSKSLLHQGLSEPEFYGDFIYKFKKIRGLTDFSDQFRKIIIRNERIGYNLNVMRQSACLVINPITVNDYATLFNCTPVDRASDSMMAPT